MKPTGTFSIICSNCQTEQDFAANEADFESNGGDERQMGSENSYLWADSFTCEGCEDEISFEYSVYEYPAGVLNMEQIDIEGGKESSTYSFEFFRREDFDDNDEEIEEDRP